MMAVSVGPAGEFTHGEGHYLVIRKEGPWAGTATIGHVTWWPIEGTDRRRLMVEFVGNEEPIKLSDACLYVDVVAKLDLEKIAADFGRVVKPWPSAG